MAIITGTSGDDYLAGTSDADVIQGLAGNDILVSGGGLDQMFGGDGSDIYLVSNGGELIFENSGEGSDIVYVLSAYYALAAGSFVEALSVSDHALTTRIDLTGNELANSIYGNAGVNVLNGGAGADFMKGFGGDDIYLVDNTFDVVEELSGGGIDIVFALASYALGAGVHVETLSVTNHAATTAINLTGNELDNQIFGNDGVNVLVGGGGTDLLKGFGGNDTYLVDSAGDIVDEVSGGGNDIVFALASYTLGAGVHVESLSVTSHTATSAINLSGNELDNQIFGNDGVNVLVGGGGTDLLKGFGGNDTYLVDSAGDIVQELAGGGTDIVFALASYTLAAGVHVESLSVTSHTATSAINLTGNELDNQIFGNDGVNVLVGGGGTDLLKGFGGDDTYLVDSAGDIVQELAGGGTDIVFALASYTLAAGVHAETLSVTNHAATTAINLTGNELDNQIFGNDGVNVLVGGGGTDLLKGFGGDDTYLVDSAGDIVQELAGGGNDIVFALASYTLGAGVHVETLSVTNHGATSAINLTGNELDNQIFGNDGVNVLVGGGGTDTLKGFGGNDTYLVDSAGDIVQELAGGGNDIVFALASYALAAGVDIETLSVTDHGATTAINLTGNELANQIFGNAGANLLSGLGGNDVLSGFGGVDTFVFTAPLGAGNIDIITDFAAGVDKILLAGSAGEPFSVLAAGALTAGAFVIGAGALDANDYLIYNSGTGALLYDADGNGAGAAVQFASLSTGLALTAGDFAVSGPTNNPPAISSGTTANVNENSPASTIVYQTVATDADGDRITYSLTGADAALLNIDVLTGAVRLNASPDFETKTSYSFSVVASDSEGSTSRAVLLSINNLADASTPIINEQPGANGNTAAAQGIDRAILAVAPNGNLPDDDLPSATIVGEISNSSDRDFFSIMLQAGEKLILDVDNSGGNLDAHLRVYGPNGVEIGDNDDPGFNDPGSPPHPTYGHNTDSQISFRAGTTGIYYFSLESFQDAGNPTQGTYELHVSVGPPATAAQLLQEDVDALVSGAEWNHTNITYGFPLTAGQYPSNFREVTPTSEFSPFNTLQQQSTRQLVQLVANVSSLTFTELFGGADHTSGAGSADLRYGMTTDPEAEVAYAYYPTNGGATSPGGSAWFNTTDFNAPRKGNYAWMGILHETGHALGLKHGHEFPAISPERNSVEYSVMTYRSYPGQSLSGGGGYTNEDWGYPQTLMMLDIAALQQMYGANFAFNAGNSVYTWSPTTGEMSINGVGQGAPGDNDGIVEAEENRILMTVWDGGGTDTYDLSNYSGNCVIDLRPGEWSRTGAAQLADLRDSAGGPHFARGNIANALLFEGNTSSLIENAIGGSGADQLTANQAKNSLTGGAGTDTFFWKTIADAGLAAQADVVTDFTRNPERLDLSAIDAVTATGSDDPFSYLGTGAFTGVAGQLRSEVNGANINVFGDVNGDMVADFQIIVNNQAILASTDFIL